MISTHAHPIDTQLSLSILFLALSENAQEEPRRAAIAKSERPVRERETTYEEPERWDGLW